jgi:hypothetical protein
MADCFELSFILSFMLKSVDTVESSAQGPMCVW